MAKGKNYTFEVRDGQFYFTVRMTADGKPHSLVGAYPLIQSTDNGIKYYTKRETEKWCNEFAIANGWYATEEQVLKRPRRKKATASNK